MKIRYLGTAAAEGFPALFCNCSVCARARKLGGKNLRSRSQAVIDDSLLIDFPPDTYYHTISGNLSLPKIKNLIVTHSHSDHCYMLDVMQRDEPFAHGIPAEKLHIFGNQEVRRVYYNARAEFSHIDSEDTAEFTFVKPFVSFQAGEYSVTPLKATHDKREDCYIYIIQKDEKRILYANDTGFFPEETWEYIKPLRFDLVSLDCTMGLVRDGKNHMGFEDDLELRSRLLKMKCADEDTKFIVTHFSHNGGLLQDEIQEKIKDYGVTAAYDGMEISI